MTLPDISDDWAARYGLALTPLFETEESSVPGFHNVLLDGGYGSFALSVSKERIWESGQPLDWSWSSNLPHHVTVTSDEVGVVRWDKQHPELFSRSSIEKQTDAFYSYLTADRVKSNRRVIEHMLQLFRRVRSLVGNSGLDDETSIDAYLAFLARALAVSRDKSKSSILQTPTYVEHDYLINLLPQNGVDDLIDDFTVRRPPDQPVNLIPSLALRHAGSEIFQEANFELLRVPTLDLLGHVEPAHSRRVKGSGAHFTPPALARSIVEQSLKHIPKLAEYSALKILDPACGSGSFLHEALRTLRRVGYNGHICLIGRDISRPAISMARFVLENALLDWRPRGGCTIELQQGDSLQLPLPSVDLIVMNPPFISWSGMKDEQRQQMREMLGSRLTGKGDYSMAFISRALDALRSGGVLGTLLPGSLLTLQAANAWRKSLLERADPRFLASLGEFGLFAHAQVQVAAAVFVNPVPGVARSEQLTALITANDPDATGNALRALRVEDGVHTRIPIDDGWRLFRTSVERLKTSATWRLMPRRVETAVEGMLSSGLGITIDEIFDVHQGVQTGLNAAFVLSDAELHALPRSERKWFQTAILSESIVHGRIETKHYVFYPYRNGKLSLNEEEALVRELPVYFQQYLEPNRSRLEKRADVRSARKAVWWGLFRRRNWVSDRRPRMVSKYFGTAGSFATDLQAEQIVVQGFVWVPKWNQTEDEVDEETAAVGLPEEQVLSAYSALMNSHPFSRVLSLFSPHVAGGQYDLSPRYVKYVPVPDLVATAADDRLGAIVLRLGELGKRSAESDVEWYAEIDNLATRLYGDDILSQI